jgi:L-glyceraldehyde 3-phosphate reductase
MSTRMLSDDTLARVRGLNEIASGRGQTLAQLALSWALRDERVTSVLIGASSVEQLDDNLAAVQNLAFSAEELAAIDEFAGDRDIDLWAASSRVG